MPSKVQKALRNPHLILPYFRMLAKRLALRKVRKNGQEFYRYEGEFYPAYLTRGNAASFILDKAKQFCSGKGVNVGASRWPFPGATPIQEGGDQDAYKLDSIPDDSLDYVFSSHCLEHLDRWQEALELWISKIKMGGVLFLYLPHESMKLWHRGSPWVRDDHRWRPTYQVINPFLQRNGMGIVEYEADRDQYWSFHIVARKIGT